VLPYSVTAAVSFRSGPPATLRASAAQNRRPLAAPGCQLVPQSLSENSKGACFSSKAGMARRDERAYPHGSVSEKQRRQTGLAAKTLRAAGLLPVDFVGAALTARFGDARALPPRPQSKSLAAEPLSIFRQALSRNGSAFRFPPICSGYDARACASGPPQMGGRSTRPRSGRATRQTRPTRPLTKPSATLRGQKVLVSVFDMAPFF